MTCVGVRFFGAVFIVARDWEQPKYSSVEYWLNEF